MTGHAIPLGIRFELFVRDVERSVDFYSSTLGLQPPEGWAPDGYVPISAGAVTIGLQQIDNLRADHHFAPGMGGRLGVGVEIVIEVDDVDRAYSNAEPSVERCGGNIQALKDRPWGLRDFRLIDPDSYYVRVTSRAQ